jgi:hypothetical protein
MAGKDLDALAKGLAEERISRGRALKRMGAVLFGGLLASVPMGAAFAFRRPRSDESTRNPNDLTCGSQTLCTRNVRGVKSSWCCGPNDTCGSTVGSCIH